MSARREWILVALLAVAGLAGCAPKAPSGTFDLMQNGQHAVANFHGFVDNFDACSQVADKFNDDSASDPAAWRAAGTTPSRWSCVEKGP